MLVEMLWFFEPSSGDSFTFDMAESSFWCYNGRNDIRNFASLLAQLGESGFDKHYVFFKVIHT